MKVNLGPCAFNEKSVSGTLLSYERQSYPAAVEKLLVEKMYLLQPSAIAYKFLAFGRAFPGFSLSPTSDVIGICPLGGLEIGRDRVAEAGIDGLLRRMQ